MKRTRPSKLKQFNSLAMTLCESTNNWSEWDYTNHLADFSIDSISGEFHQLSLISSLKNWFANSCELQISSNCVIVYFRINHTTTPDKKNSQGISY